MLDVDWFRFWEVFFRIFELKVGRSGDVYIKVVGFGWVKEVFSGLGGLED